MRILFNIAAGILATVLSFSATAADISAYSVADLLEPCMEGDNDSRWGLFAETECEQYVIGFADAYVLMGMAERDNVCLPPIGNRADEIRWAFMKWAHQHFKDRQMPAAEGLLAAIRSDFSCKK